MWGNKLGWMISAVLVVVMSAAIAMAYMASSKRTPPTKDFMDEPTHFAAIQLPMNPATLFPAEQDQDDAGPIYARVVEDYKQNRAVYEQLRQRFDLAKAQQLPGLQAVLDAAGHSKADLVGGKVANFVGYRSKQPVEALQAAGALCVRAGTDLANRKQFEESKRYLLAAFVLGDRLFEQRLSKDQLVFGLGLMHGSAGVLEQIATSLKQADEAAKYKDFLNKYQAYAQQIETVDRVITSIDPKVLAQHVGDVFEIVDKSQERVWRVEATLKLGMYKYYTNTPGDRRAAIRKVRELRKDSDPAVAAAAMAARELTEDQYRMLGNE